MRRKGWECSEYWRGRVVTGVPREAVSDAGVEWIPELRERTAIVSGSCVGGQSTEDEGFAGLYRNNNPRVNPFTIPRTMANAAASRISVEYGVVGPTYTVSTACFSSNHAIGQAFWMVRRGLAEMAITGGSEAIFSLGCLKAWEAMRVVSPDTCRPFSKDRRQFDVVMAGPGLRRQRDARKRYRFATDAGYINRNAVASNHRILVE